jgi:hypothetical protein
MRRFIIAALLGTACAAPDLSQGDTSGQFNLWVTTAAPITAGHSVAAVLRNASGGLVRIGAIGCYVQFDRFRAGAWEPVPPDYVVCTQPEYSIPTGGMFPFEFAAPAAAGTYRLRVGVESDVVRSAAFTVR